MSALDLKIAPLHTLGGEGEARYPVYVPTKGRYEYGQTIRALQKDGVKVHIVVEEPEAEEYGSRYGHENVLTIPWVGSEQGVSSDFRERFAAERDIEPGNLICVRNWIREHSIEAYGAARHWQFDDNICAFRRWYKGERMYADAKTVLRCMEDFSDRYIELAVSGIEYTMFASNPRPAYNVNHRVYSASLINNAAPIRWRIAYNEDTDICLQAISQGWNTVLVNAFLCDKVATMVLKGGNTDESYQGRGRLRMARTLERVWPGIVTTKRRFGRPQHVLDWSKLHFPLRRRTDIDWEAVPEIDEYGFQLHKSKDVESKRLKRFLDRNELEPTFRDDIKFRTDRS